MKENSHTINQHYKTAMMRNVELEHMLNKVKKENKDLKE